jgi:RNA polymerase-binding transcription factor DksA
LLLEKLEELSASRGKAETVVPGAGSWQGDAADQANSDTEADLQIRLHQTDGRLMRAIEEALVRAKQGTHMAFV